MSDVKKGADRVGIFLTQLWKLGYRASRVSASGQRRGKRKEQDMIPGDAIGFSIVFFYPHVLAEVGGSGKRVRVALAELTKSPLPAGFAPIVARVVKRKWRYYCKCATYHERLAHALTCQDCS